MTKIIPDFFFGRPVWVRKLWCLLRGYHTDEVIVYVDWALYESGKPITVNCGCCGKLRFKVYTPFSMACPHRWIDDPKINEPCAECENNNRIR